MNNFEKHIDEIKNYVVDNLTITKDGRIRPCNGLDCGECIIYENRICTLEKCKSFWLGEQTDETLNVMKEENAYEPTRAHAIDAGLDLYARESAYVLARESCVFDTGVHVEIPEGYFGLMLSKSGLNVKHGLTSEGIIDSGYSGSIKVKLYNNSGYDYKVEAGDKISQLIIIPCMLPKVKLVEKLEKTERGEGGFGSSGK